MSKTLNKLDNNQVTNVYSVSHQKSFAQNKGTINFNSNNSIQNYVVPINASTPMSIEDYTVKPTFYKVLEISPSFVDPFLITVDTKFLKKLYDFSSYNRFLNFELTFHLQLNTLANFQGRLLVSYDAKPRNYYKFLKNYGLTTTKYSTNQLYQMPHKEIYLDMPSTKIVNFPIQFPFRSFYSPKQDYLDDYDFGTLIIYPLTSIQTNNEYKTVYMDIKTQLTLINRQANTMT
jgi:hypothetical protein